MNFKKQPYTLCSLRISVLNLRILTLSAFSLSVLCSAEITTQQIIQVQNSTTQANSEGSVDNLPENILPGELIHIQNPALKPVKQIEYDIKTTPDTTFTSAPEDTRVSARELSQIKGHNEEAVEQVDPEKKSTGKAAETAFNIPLNNCFKSAEKFYRKYNLSLDDSQKDLLNKILCDGRESPSETEFLAILEDARKNRQFPELVHVYVACLTGPVNSPELPKKSTKKESH